MIRIIRAFLFYAQTHGQKSLSQSSLHSKDIKLIEIGK